MTQPGYRIQLRDRLAEAVFLFTMRLPANADVPWDELARVAFEVADAFLEARET